MAVLVKIPTQLRSAAGGETETEVDGAHLPALQMPPPAKKTRVRSLLKPMSR